MQHTAVRVHLRPPKPAGLLMHKRPTAVESRAPELVPERVQEALERLARVYTEDGNGLTGEAFVTPRCERNLRERVQQATALANAVEWRLHGINIMAVRSIE